MVQVLHRAITMSSGREKIHLGKDLSGRRDRPNPEIKSLNNGYIWEGRILEAQAMGNNHEFHSPWRWGPGVTDNVWERVIHPQREILKGTSQLPERSWSAESLASSIPKAKACRRREKPWKEQSGEHRKAIRNGRHTSLMTEDRDRGPHRQAWLTEWLHCS